MLSYHNVLHEIKVFWPPWEPKFKKQKQTTEVVFKAKQKWEGCTYPRSPWSPVLGDGVFSSLHQQSAFLVGWPAVSAVWSGQEKGTACSPLPISLWGVAGCWCSSPEGPAQVTHPVFTSPYLLPSHLILSRRNWGTTAGNTTTFNTESLRFSGFST